MLGLTGAAVSMVTLSALEAALVLPATSVAVAVRLWAPLVSAAVVKLQAPLPSAVADAEQRGAVIDLDGGIGFRAAGERQGIVIGDAIARRAAVGRVRGNRRGGRGTGVDVTLSALEAALVLPATSVAVAVRLWAPLASAAVV